MVRDIIKAAPKVSVLVPVYNGEIFLRECLDSVLAQDFGDMEILISDDDSSDQSRALIENYAARDARIRWWKNPRRLGLTANSNACLRAARGEYIKFVHQDDKLLSPFALQKMAAALDQNPGAVLAGCQHYFIGTKCQPPFSFRKAGLCDGKKTMVACLERNSNIIGSPTFTLFRSSRARRGFDERFTCMMDFEMWSHLLEQGDFVHLAEPLAAWRVHERQQTAVRRANGQSHREHLLLMEIYYAKPWLRKAASRRLLFSQIHYLKKKYGRDADALTREMIADLPSGSYAWEWSKHRISRPLQNFCRKLHQFKTMSFMTIAR